MLFIKKAFPNNVYYTLGAGFLITICPYFIMMSRVGIESHLMLGASTAFLYFFTCALTTGKYKHYIMAGISGGIVLYSYAVSYLMLPLFLLFSLIYVIRIHKFSFKKWCAMGIPLFLLAFPLIMTQFINLFDWPEMHLGIFTLTKLPEYRSSELQLFSFDSLWLSIQNILFGDMWIYNSIPGTPNMYWISVPFIIIGLGHCIYRTVFAFRKREFDFRVFSFFWFFCILYMTCHITPCITQANGIFFVFVFFVIDAISLITIKKRAWNMLAKSGIAAIYAISFFFTYYYLGQYTLDNYPLGYFYNRVPEAIQFIEEHREYGPKGAQMSELPIHFALSSLYSPYDLQLFDPEELYLMDGYYHCNCLGPIEDGYFYIVRDVYGEYAALLRSEGFSEINYGNYYLFYQEPAVQN